MKNIHVLPTSQPSRLGYLSKKGKEVYNDLRLFSKLMPNILDSENQNIYITSSEEINAKDWCYDEEKNLIFQFNSPTGLSLYIKSKQKFVKKIILTTDVQLIKDGVQKIDDEFLEWFVKNPSCEEVVVIKEYFWEDTFRGYSLRLPQEETKQECNGDILTCLNEKCICKHNKIMEKETVEQGFDRIYDSIDFTEFCFPSFKLGVKWEQEQNGLTPMDLIEFSKWVNKMGYSHRLTLIPNDLIDFYLTNRENIIKLNLE